MIVCIIDTNFQFSHPYLIIQTCNKDDLYLLTLPHAFSQVLGRCAPHNFLHITHSIAQKNGKAYQSTAEGQEAIKDVNLFTKLPIYFKPYP